MPYAGSPDEKLRRSRQYTTQRAAKDPAWHAERKRRRVHGAQMQQLALKIIVHQVKSVPCMDCGGRFPVECMDLDHRPGEGKVINVSRMMTTGRFSEAALLAEIAKCDLVCANCHRIRTRKRKGKEPR